MSLVTSRPEDLSRDGEAMIQAARNLVVRDDASYTEAGERRRLVKAYLQRVADLFDPIDRAQIEARRVTISQRKWVEQYALEADEIYKRGRLGYEDALHLARLEAEQLAAIERERVEAEARAVAEVETERLRTAEEDRRLAAATAAEARGDHESAERIIAAPIVVPTVAPAIAFTPPTASNAPPRVEGIASRMDWDYEVVDAALLPREYLVVNDKAIRGVVRALKDKTSIPGVRVFPRRNEAVRAR